jgi:DNA-binding NarL/FixJ family response regulator
MRERARPTAVLTDDHPAVLAAIGSILQKEFEIVAMASDGVRALDAVTLFHPDLLVLDITMSGWNGFETAKRIIEASLSTKILFLTIYEDIDYLEKARQMGASYVIKRRMQKELLAAALETLAGKLFFSDLSERKL